MNKRYGTFWRPGAGLTLVETLAGMALLGTLLTAILIADARLKVQSRHAQQRIEACRIADALLDGWWKDRSKFPRMDSGTVNESGWRWRTHVLENDHAEALNAQMIALEIHAPDEPDRPATQTTVLLKKEPTTRATSQP